MSKLKMWCFGSWCGMVLMATLFKLVVVARIMILISIGMIFMWLFSRISGESRPRSLRKNFRKDV